MEKNKTKKAAVCPVAKKCGGCEFQGMPYAEQLRHKEKRVRILLDSFGKVHPIIGMKDPWSDVDEVIHASRKQRIPIYVYEDANHSLETGQVIQDLDILKDVMIKTNNYLSVEKH